VLVDWRVGGLMCDVMLFALSKKVTWTGLGSNKSIRQRLSTDGLLTTIPEISSAEIFVK
jgi:hypothetical protein